MLLAVVVYSLAVFAGQANHEVIKPNPNAAPSTMARFGDVHQREFIEEFRREQKLAYRQAVIAHRIALADQLDRLIANGECGQAVEVAQGAGYRDIREAVAGLCTVKASYPVL
jgi:hypothetical protein